MSDDELDNPALLHREQNVEVVRRNLRAWQRDDLEAFLLRTHPEIEWHAVLERLVEGPCA